MRPIKTNACCSGLSQLISPQMFKAIGDPKRVAILIRLAECQRPCTVSEIASCCPVDISGVSRHLAILRDAGILTATKLGKQVLYQICSQSLVDTLRNIANAIESCCSAPGRKETVD